LALLVLAGEDAGLADPGASVDDADACNQGDDPATLHAGLRWVAGGDGGVVLRAAALPAGLSWDLVVRARLGHLFFDWTEPELVEGDGEHIFVLTPPDDAFLDPLAESYVTSLRVRLRGTDEEGHVQFLEGAPPAFLAWPSGQSSKVVVWDEQGMQEAAPNGVLNSDVRSAAGVLPTGAMLMPPLQRAGKVTDGADLGEKTP
jgi:hypothetical protein